MGTDKGEMFLILTHYERVELRGLNYSDWITIRSNQNVFRLVEQLASEKKRLEEENKRLIEEYKLLESYYKSVRNQRDELIDDNIAMKEQNEQLIADNNLYYEELVKVKNIVCEAHSTIDINFNVRFVDGC